jgi:hypothetical protein
MIGNLFTPRLGPTLGYRWGRQSTSVGTRMRSGSKIMRRKRGYDVADFSFQKIPYPDAMRLYEMNRIYQDDIPVVVKWDPDNDDPNYQQHCIIYGYLQWRSGGAFSSAAAYGYTNVDVSIEEV